MHRALLYIGLSTILQTGSLFGQGTSNSIQDSFNIVYINLNPKQQFLYNKLDGHINKLSKKIYDLCMNHKTSMRGSLPQHINNPEQIKTCMLTNLNACCYGENPKNFIKMMNQLKIPKEDWEYANALYVQIIHNKYTR